jgi:hypothetical protein
MAKRPKRYLKSEFGIRKKALPVALTFVKDFNFHAIVEDSSGQKVKTIIEVKPLSLKKLINRVNDLTKNNLANEQEMDLIKAEMDLIKAENVKCKEFFELVMPYMKQLESNNEILLNELKKEPDLPYIRSQKNWQNIIEESGFIEFLPPVQGGLPSLGKRR